MKQLAREIFINELELSKKLFDLLAFKLGEDSKEFQYLRKQIFDYLYNGLHKLYKELEKEGLIEKCGCNTKIRLGYSEDCKICNGAGWKNKVEQKSKDRKVSKK